MGMTITVEVIDEGVVEEDLEKVFLYFDYVDQKFSTYKETSEISLINKGEIKESEYSQDMKIVFKLSEETKQLTNGYFDIRKNDGKIDPSGLVKGWAIYNSSKILKANGFNNFFVDAGGDIEVSGKNLEGDNWKVGIQNPFKPKEIIKVVSLSSCGMATSGTYIRGQHIYNPFKPSEALEEIVSLSVIGPNVYEADRFATSGFAMGREGINFIESLDGFEGYMVDLKGLATETSNFGKYVCK